MKLFCSMKKYRIPFGSLINNDYTTTTFHENEANLTLPRFVSQLFQSNLLGLQNGTVCYVLTFKPCSNDRQSSVLHWTKWMSERTFLVLKDHDIFKCNFWFGTWLICSPVFLNIPKWNYNFPICQYGWFVSFNFSRHTSQYFGKHQDNFFEVFGNFGSVTLEF